jgi:predicted enzyme related to lactoylglutathione lyase
MSTAATSVGRFVWHEQVSSDPKQAQDFYTRLFGWGSEIYGPGDVDYAMIASGGSTHGGYGRAMEGAPPPHWLSHVRVDDVDETVEKAKAAGGSVAAGPLDMGEVGRMAVIGDPQGAFVSAYQPRGEGPVPEGVFVWDELITSDVDGAQRFYEQVFGWRTTDMGSEYGNYRVFDRGETGTGVAGLMARMQDTIPPHWQPYVAVDDPDATTAKAKELGATVLLEPMDVPEVGRLGVLMDPQGATFGIIKPQPPAA